jgi:transcription termination factor Rho
MSDTELNINEPIAPQDSAPCSTEANPAVIEYQISGPEAGPLPSVEPIEASAPASSVLVEVMGAVPPFPEEISVNDLQEKGLGELLALAEEVGWRTNASRTKHQLIYDLLVWMGQHKTKLSMEGFLEIGSDNFGLIRYPKYSFAPLPEDVFVPLFLVRKFQLQPGQKIKGYAKAPREKEKYLAIDRIVEIEGRTIESWEPPVAFDKLTATFPTGRIIMETPKDSSVSARVIDLVAPLGKGQRALICASPRSGKTMLLKEVAKSITVNHPEISLIVLLLDERPEEVTDFEETVQGCEIYSSTFDESPKRHTQVAELVAERAKRLVEQGKDVVILLDSITRLARGYNALQGGKGRTMSGGVESKALMKPKKFFGAARNVEEGGSLTIVATALIETESRMDEVIFEEFKGTGNMEINLDREISERRIFPAIHVLKSGTRRDDLLYHPEEFKRVSVVRKQLSAVPAYESIELLIRNIQKTGNNAELLLKGLKS